MSQAVTITLYDQIKLAISIKNLREDINTPVTDQDVIEYLKEHVEEYAMRFRNIKSDMLVSLPNINMF